MINNLVNNLADVNVSILHSPTAFHEYIDNPRVKYQVYPHHKQKSHEVVGRFEHLLKWQVLPVAYNQIFWIWPDIGQKQKKTDRETGADDVLKPHSLYTIHTNN